MEKVFYDYIVIGSGPAGYVSAVKAAELGKKVAIVEKDKNKLGGVCLNEGCIPAKSLFHTALLLKEAGEFCPDIHADMEMILSRSRKAQDKLKKGIEFLFGKNKIDVLFGEAVFTATDELSVLQDGHEIHCQFSKALIATGSVPRGIKNLEFDGSRVIYSTQAIVLNELPENMCIVGGGAIGVEFASYFNTLGVCVTLLEAEPYILPLEDQEISKRMQSILKRQGINIVTEAGDEDLSKYNMIIMAVGRKPSTDNLGLKEAGVEKDEKGFIRVDDDLCTTNSNIYAAGDVVNSPMLAHVASKEGENAAIAAFGGKINSIIYENIPNAVYSEIKVASVGRTEQYLKEKGIDYKIGKQFFMANGRAVVMNATEGFIKILADAKDGSILGVHIIGPSADELIHPFVVAKQTGITIDALKDVVFAHPTLSETCVEAIKSLSS